MSQPFVGEIRIFAGNFAPSGWMFCAGQLLPIAQYEALYSLIGTTYGGDGQSTFALPNLQGRIPIHSGTSTSGGSYVTGEQGGTESVTLTPAQMPAHTHPLYATKDPANQRNPAGSRFALTESPLYAAPDPSPATLAGEALGFAGSGQPHSNLQPYLCVSFIISLFGIYPSPT